MEEGKMAKMNNNFFPKKGQITLFVIIAIVIVAAIVLIFAFRDTLFSNNENSEFSEVYIYFDDCVKQDTLQGLKIAGAQGGYIEVPDFNPGSTYAPFSSQLDFLGNPIPYWYYATGNGVIKEQVPSQSMVEKQLENYLNQQIKQCDFSQFLNKGFFIKNDNINTKVQISDNKVRVLIDSDLVVSKDNASSILTNRQVDVNSKFGKFFNLANNIYNKEKANAFLENYSLDVLYSYAPVTGVELSCAPKIWKANEVADNIKQGLSANIGALKVKGSYYSLNNKDNKYFIIKDIQTDDAVSFVYNPSWPTRVEVWPADNNLLIAKPVGLEQGMGIIGFCYIPYHFVYDIYYPVLVQIYDGNELFQFPVSVLIDKSLARNGINGQSIEDLGSVDQICNYKNTDAMIYTYDSNLNPISADLSFQCFSTECDIGTTNITGKDSILKTQLPQCINGKIIAKAEEFVTQEYIASTNEPLVANILMDKLYTLNLNLNLDGQKFNAQEGDLAIINFESEKNSFSVAYPTQSEVKLSQGYYNISIQIFSGASLTIPASSKTQCVNVPKKGILGFFGQANQQCFNIDLPAQTISKALSAGGKSSEFILEENLRESKTINIFVNSLPVPNSLDQLQQNYELINNKQARINFS
jgi:hypothetical protein